MVPGKNQNKWGETNGSPLCGAQNEDGAGHTEEGRGCDESQTHTREGVTSLEGGFSESGETPKCVCLKAAGCIWRAGTAVVWWVG